MKFNIALLLPVFGLALAVPAPSTNPATSDMTYTGPITPGGENVTLTGTASDIYRQILNLNPAFNPGDFEVIRDARARLKARDITPRTKSGLTCDIATPNYNHQASINAIQQGIDQLYRIPGSCGVGGHAAIRLTCSSNSAIWMVNNSDGPLEAQCQYLADLARDVVNTCPGSFSVNGQELDSAGYVVVVAESEC